MVKDKKPKKTEIEWLKDNSIVVKTVKAGNGFDDLKQLNDIIGDSTIVSLGEATHGTKEIFHMKHRIIEYLAIEKGFDIFAIEAAMPEAYKLNDYVLHGKGEPKKLVLGMILWCWSTEEVLEMVLWMRKFNESGKGKIQFTGFDMQSINGALDNLRNFAVKNDKSLIPALDIMAETDKKRTDIMKELFDSISSKVKEVKTDEEKLSIIKEVYNTPVHLNQGILTNSDLIYKHVTDNKDKYLKILSVYEYEWLKQNANIIVKYSKNATIAFDESNKFRDKCMAENIKWILNNNPKSKIVLWAHNGHVCKRDTMMGSHLQKMYGNLMKVFGFVIGQGTYTAFDHVKGLNSDNLFESPKKGSAEDYFQRTGNPIFILDLKKVKADNPDSKWLLEEQLVRSADALSRDNSYYLENLSIFYDSIIYINKTSSSVLIKKVKA